MKKLAAFAIIPFLIFSLTTPCLAGSGGLKEGSASLLIPGWGQYLNGEFETQGGRWKVGLMAAVEVAAIVTTAVVGGVVGYPQIWIGIGLFIGNHAWSALDAFLNAKAGPSVSLSTKSPIEKTTVAQ